MIVQSGVLPKAAPAAVKAAAAKQQNQDHDNQN
jgi:hypothetical protein